MRAAVLHRFAAPLELREAPDPHVRDGETMVRVRAAGLCRTDLKIIDGGIPTVELPRILGHEPAGEVVALGAGASGLEIGQRVFVRLDLECGTCAYCREGRLDYCARLRRLGFEQDGALAEYVTVPASNAIPLDERISYEVGATLSDAVGSSYHAVITRARTAPGDTVLIYGLGGLGLCAVQIAATRGARVIAVARNPERRTLAQRFGADAVLDPREQLVTAVRDLTGGLGVHAFLDFVGSAESLAAAVPACRKGGRVVVVGYTAPELRTATMDLVLREVSVTGSRSSSRSELEASAALVAEGRVTPVVDRVVDLDEVNDGIAALREGSVVGRLIVRPTPVPH